MKIYLRREQCKGHKKNPVNMIEMFICITPKYTGGGAAPTPPHRWFISMNDCLYTSYCSKSTRAACSVCPLKYTSLLFWSNGRGSCNKLAQCITCRTGSWVQRENWEIVKIKIPVFRMIVFNCAKGFVLKSTGWRKTHHRIQTHMIINGMSNPFVKDNIRHDMEINFRINGSEWLVT